MAVLTETLFEKCVGSDRWMRYKSACVGNDAATAIRLYAWNVRVASALMEMLGHVEVIVRNAIHRELTAAHAASGRAGEW